MSIGRITSTGRRVSSIYFSAEEIDWVGLGSEGDSWLCIYVRDEEEKRIFREMMKSMMQDQSLNEVARVVLNNENGWITIGRPRGYEIDPQTNSFRVYSDHGTPVPPYKTYTPSGFTTANLKLLNEKISR